MSTELANEYHCKANGVTNGTHIETPSMDMDDAALKQRANYKHEWQAVDARKRVSGRT